MCYIMPGILLRIHTNPSTAPLEIVGEGICVELEV